MLKGFLSALVVSIVMALAGSVGAYDATLAESYADLFAPVQGAKAGKALHLMKADAFIKKLQTKEPMVVLDVRTPAEAGVIGMTMPGALAISIDQLFTPDNLERIPTDTPVVVLCLSGTRATAAGTALRHVGFKNVYILKGGMKALIGALGPKEANSPPPTKQ